MSDFEQCSKQLQLFSLLVNFSYELCKIMARYDFLDAGFVILRNIQTDWNMTYFGFCSTYEFGQIMIRYDFLEARIINLTSWFPASAWPRLA